MDVTCSFVSVTCSFVGVTCSFVGVTCSFDPITFRCAIPKWCVCLRFITWHLPFETRRLPFKVHCLKIIKTEPVYTCKKRLLTSSSLWYHLKTYTSFYLKKLVCFALKLIKLASKHDSYSSRTVGFRNLIAYIFSHLNDFRFKRQTSCYET